MANITVLLTCTQNVLAELCLKSSVFKHFNSVGQAKGGFQVIYCPKFYLI